MAKPGTPSQGEYVELPEMEWIKCQIERHELYKDSYQGGEEKERVKVFFKALDPEYEGGKFVYFAGFSLHEKSKLTPLAEAIMGLKGEELFEAFDTDMLDDAVVQVIGKNVTKKNKDGEDRTYFTPTMFKGSKSKPSSKPAKAAKPAREEPDDDDLDI